MKRYDSHTIERLEKAGASTLLAPSAGERLYVRRVLELHDGGLR